MIKYEAALRDSQIFKSVKRDIDNQVMSHAYMVVSPDGEATKELFKLIAAAVYCKNKNACLDCEECNKVLEGRNLDVNFINNLEKKLAVDDVNELVESSMLAPRVGDKKLYFIHSAEQMNTAAQNKLLKTLEEPPRSVVIFLGVKNQSAMLETIKSRVRLLTMDVFSAEVIYREMLAITSDQQKSRVAAACSQGMLGFAERIVSSDDFTAQYDKAFDILRNTQKSKDVVKFLGDKSLKDGESLNRTLDIFSIIFRDIMVSKADKSLIQSKHREQDIMALSAEYNPLAVSKILFLINEERKKIKFNVSGVSVMENLLLGILEVKYLCR